MQLSEVISGAEIYVDLDGVLANFVKGLERLTGEKFSPKITDETWDKIKEVSNPKDKFWENLPKMPDADKLWKYVKSHNPMVLTAAGDWDTQEVGRQKKNWVKKYLGLNANKVIIVPDSESKAKYAKPYRILIDDRDKSIDPWVAAGGIGILHTNAANSIRQLKQLGL